MADETKRKFGRRGLLKGFGAGALAFAAPHVWIPKAVAATSGRGTVKHLLYIRLSGGFRFTAAFNGAVDGRFNPFEPSTARAANAEWTPSKLLERAPFLEGSDATVARRVELGMKPVSAVADRICVLPCVDHEPFAARADGNHGTGLERFLTGYVGGGTSFLTYVNWGLRERDTGGKVSLPAFSLGEAGMATGAGPFAAFRAPVLDGAGFDGFDFDAATGLPDWARNLASSRDERLRRRLHPSLRAPVEAYQQSRAAAAEYGKIFRGDDLKIGGGGQVATRPFDGITHQELDTIFGTDRTGRRVSLALRLFRHGCPAVFLNQGGYDLHSGEEQGLPGEIERMNRIISGLVAVLPRMTHPAGGTYWDHTVVVLGSEFGRTAGGQKFNSAGGSDHSSDYATRWMSMPFFGGVIDQAKKAGANLGGVRRDTLEATGAVYSYRAVLKTLLDWLGADHEGIFPADRPIEDFFS